VNRGIVLTDTTLELASRLQADLDSETAARHQLVETAWSTGVGVGLISFESKTETLFMGEQAQRRPVTGVIPALNGYQDGRCAYCDVHMRRGVMPPQVEHVLPFVLKARGWHSYDVDQLWNLVLACRDCNAAKSGRAPHADWMPWLVTRNEDLIASRHPLRDTLIKQTGTTYSEREQFLLGAYREATTKLPSVWTPAKN